MYVYIYMYQTDLSMEEMLLLLINLMENGGAMAARKLPSISRYP